MRYPAFLLRLAASVLVTCGPVTPSVAQVAQVAQENAAPDLMSIARGVLPVSIDTAGTPLRVEMTEAIAVIDGNPASVVVTQKPGAAGTVVEITYALPALTRFSRLAVPGVLETASPSQTFFRNVTVSGSALSPEGPWAPLAAGTLDTHSAPGLETELALVADQPEVLWVRLRLADGIHVETDRTFFEFSELIGNGVQQEPELSLRFNGVWTGRGVKIELAQDAGVVNGCYDGDGRLAGTVEGKVLRALGRNDAGIASQFVLIATEDGALRGLRSTNGAPFKPYEGETTGKAATCLSPAPPRLGCGSILHGIGFDYDSDVIRPGSRALVASLFEGLKGAGGTAIEIVGHSSSEGSADYNRDLSARRAQSVVAALIALGLDPTVISAAGRGEDEPIASNEDEAGRALNRRVEVRCAG